MSSRKKRVRKAKSVEEKKVELPDPEPEPEPEPEPDEKIEDVADLTPNPGDKYKCDVCDHTLLYKNLTRHKQSKVHTNKL